MKIATSKSTVSVSSATIGAEDIEMFAGKICRYLSDHHSARIPTELAV